MSLWSSVYPSTLVNNGERGGRFHYIQNEKYKPLRSIPCYNDTLVNEAAITVEGGVTNVAERRTEKGHVASYTYIDKRNTWSHPPSSSKMIHVWGRSGLTCSTLADDGDEYVRCEKSSGLMRTEAFGKKQPWIFLRYYVSTGLRKIINLFSGCDQFLIQDSNEAAHLARSVSCRFSL
jgi:hypothetical protein